MTPPSEGDDMRYEYDYEVVEGSDGQPFIRVSSSLCAEGSHVSCVGVDCSCRCHHPTEVEA